MTNQKKKMISRPNVVDNLTLDTEVAQRCYQRTFAEVLRNVYSISIVARIVLEDETSVDDLNDLLSEKFNGMSELMDKEMARLTKLRDDNAITAKLKYSNPLVVEVEVSSPMASHYLQLLKKLDAIVKLLDCLWLGEELDAKQKLRGEYEWQRRLIKLANQARDTYNRTRALNKATDDGVDAESDVKAVTDTDAKTASESPVLAQKDETTKAAPKKASAKTPAKIAASKTTPAPDEKMERASA